VSALISGLTMFLLVLVGMTQNGSLPKKPGYIASGALAAVILILALVRYKRRKDAGE
jgi:hypothetical protein